MRVDVTPRQADVLPRQPVQLTVTVSNTSNVIGGYSVRVLGADPGWVEIPDDQLSLFPDETGTIVITITPPEGLPAGPRRIAVQVREWTPPHGSAIVEVDLTVPARRSVQMRVDPLMVTGGKKANFGVIVENNGNTIVHGVLDGDDAEAQTKFEFDPPDISLTPGERALVDMRVAGKRRFAGSPVIRTLSLYLDDVPETGFFADPAAAAQPAARDERTALSIATFVQKPWLSRGLLSLLGLLVAVTVFAIVITVALSRLVGQSAADRDLALQVAAARNSGGTGGNSSISGTVRLLTTGAPVSAVSVSVFSADNVQVPVATTATNSAGQYSVGNLAAGSYKISYRGAGFVQLWYPGAAQDSAATPVQLNAGASKSGLDVLVGGVPATITGKVVGDDVSASTLYLMKPPSAGSVTTADNTNSAVGPAPPPDNGDAVVQSVPVGSDGSFSLANVPSPSVYDLVVTKTGYATSTQRIDIGAGESRTGVTITLAKGDGLISGTVGSANGPIGGATVTATTGTTTVQTVSLSAGSTGAEGSFTLRGLPTPASFTVTVSAPGFASQTQTITLTAGQKLTGASFTLAQSAGSLSGSVTLLPDNSPAPGVAVSVTNGQLTVTTETQSVPGSATGGASQVGRWTVGGLPVPGVYTVTFSRPDLASQTVSVSLDAAGNVTPGSQGATVDSNGLITVGMNSATAVVTGVVQQGTNAVRQCASATSNPSSASEPIGEATVTLSSGTATYTVTTASVPSGSVGHFRIESIPPGTWTVSVQRAGTSPTSKLITLNAGEVFQYDPVLSAPASISGKVVGSNGAAEQNWYVYVYRADQYPGTAAYTAQTNSRGIFNIPAVDAPENYVIVVQATPASAPGGSKTISIKASQQLDFGSVCGSAIQASSQ